MKSKSLKSRDMKIVGYNENYWINGNCWILPWIFYGFFCLRFCVGF